MASGRRWGKTLASYSAFRGETLEKFGVDIGPLFVEETKRVKDATDITILLDRSGSMNSIKDDVIGGFNDFVEGQKKAGDNASLTLVQFDSLGIDNVFVATPIKDAKMMTVESYEPRAMTPLLDALGQTINKTGERLSATPYEERPDKVVFVVITDGKENASHEYTKADVKALIEQQSAAYSWQFVFLTSSLEAFEEAKQFGMPAASSATFSAGLVGAAYANTSSNVTAYRNTGSRGSLTYTPDQRTAQTEPKKGRTGKKK